LKSKLAKCAERHRNVETNIPSGGVTATTQKPHAPNCK